MSRLGKVLVVGSGGVAGYVLLLRGGIVLDLGIGQRKRPLGPIKLEIAAPPGVVFDVIAGPYLNKTPHAMQEKLRVLHRGSDMVLAEHFTPAGRWLKAKTVEIVQFERPDRISFHLVRGPVPHVAETFTLSPLDGKGTAFSYTGEMTSDLWRLGELWANVVARRWEKTVEESLAGTKAEAERRSRAFRREPQ